MKIEVKSHAGVTSGEKKLSDFLFKAPINKNVLYEVLKNQLANKRKGTASVKTTGTVHGTTAKPWRQKGTGRARSGSTKSPLWRGGAVVFGPHPRDFSYRVPKKLSRAALCSVFSMFIARQKLFVMEDLSMDVYKTRKIAEILGSVTSKHRVVYVVQVPPASERGGYEHVRKSAANLPWLRVVNAEALELKDIYYADEVVLSVSAVAVLNKLAEIWENSNHRRGGVVLSSISVAKLSEPIAVAE